jgi:hypothetical protein
MGFLRLLQRNFRPLMSRTTFDFQAQQDMAPVAAMKCEGDCTSLSHSFPRQEIERKGKPGRDAIRPALASPVSSDGSGVLLL